MELFMPVKDLVLRSWNLLVKFLSALIVFVIGLLVAKLIETIIVRVLKALRIDSISEEARIQEFLSKGGIKHSLSEIIGRVVYWVVMVGVLISSLNILGLTGVSSLLDKILGYLPSVLGAMIILVVGTLISSVVAAVVRTATANTGFTQAGLLGKVTQVVVILFTILIALETLQIGKVLVSAMNIVLATIGLVVALAFGLGCRNQAEKFISDLIDKLKSKK